MRLSGVLLAIATAPYHGSLQQYTLEPIKELAAESDLNRFQKRLHSWHTAKAHELRVVQVSVSAPTLCCYAYGAESCSVVWRQRQLYLYSHGPMSRRHTGLLVDYGIGACHSQYGHS